MTKIDRTTAEQVWQRVRAEQPQPVLEQSFSAQEAEIAAQLQLLLRQFPKKAPILRPMLQETKQNIACLQGLHRLRRGERLTVPTAKPRSSDTSSLIRKCYVNCLNLAGKYDAVTQDPEYGLVFGEMAQTKRRHCRLLLSLLGTP